MSLALVPPAAASFDATSFRGMDGERTTWASPGADLWVASRPDTEGLQLLGFVERSLDDYIAVDSSGASMGRHAELGSAKRAVVAAHSPPAASASQWSDTGAPVLSVRALRAR